MNKEIDKQGKPSFSFFSGRKTSRLVPACGSMTHFAGNPAQAPGSGITGMPFTRNWVLETTTLSPGFSPAVMD
jgi:hypothetical protein